MPVTLQTAAGKSVGEIDSKHASTYIHSYTHIQEERLKHEEVRNTLTEEREKVQLAETEVKVARKQLEREQAAFEQA